jgi:hypothetical protein
MNKNNYFNTIKTAIEEGKKPESISSYLRITIKNLIDSFEKNKILSNE